MKAIAAMSENRVIGCRNRTPWHLPEDLDWFKKLTTGQIVVMGRKTFESVGQPLPHRTTVVLSRTRQHIPGVHVITALEELDRFRDTREVFVCGGAQVYAQTLGLCTDLYLTLIKRTVEGDAFFPPFEDDFVTAAIIQDQLQFRITHYQNCRAIGRGGPMSSPFTQPITP